MLADAPAGELAQVQLIRLAGQAGVADQKPGQSEPLGGREHRHHGDEGDGRVDVVIGHLPDRAETRSSGRPGPSDDD